MSRSSHPRAGWGHASYTTDFRGVTAHNATSPLAVLIIVVKRFAHEQEEEGIGHVSQRSALPGGTPHKRQMKAFVIICFVCAKHDEL